MGETEPPPGRGPSRCVLLEVVDDLVDDFGVGENGDDFHFGAAFVTYEWVHLEDFSDQACPIGPAGFGGCGARSRVLLQLEWRNSRRVVLKERFACRVSRCYMLRNSELNVDLGLGSAGREHESNRGGRAVKRCFPSVNEAGL